MRARALQLGATISAVVSVLAVWMLPVLHVHESEAHKRVVHRHVVSHVAVPDDLEMDHGDHHEAVVLTTSYVATRPFVVYPPLSRTDIVATPREYHVVARMSPSDEPVAHAPPTRAASLRAPPV